MVPKGIFSQEQEKLLVKWIFHLAKAGLPITNDILKGSVDKLAVEMGLDETPGAKWYTLFRARYAQISDRMNQNLSQYGSRKPYQLVFGGGSMPIGR